MSQSTNHLQPPEQTEAVNQRHPTGFQENKMGQYTSKDQINYNADTALQQEEAEQIKNILLEQTRENNILLVALLALNVSCIIIMVIDKLLNKRVKDAMARLTQQV